MKVCISLCKVFSVGVVCVVFCVEVMVILGVGVVFLCIIVGVVSGCGCLVSVVCGVGVGVLIFVRWLIGFFVSV